MGRSGHFGTVRRARHGLLSPVQTCRISRSNPADLSKSKFFSHFTTFVHSLIRTRLSSISQTLGLPKAFRLAENFS